MHQLQPKDWDLILEAMMINTILMQKSVQLWKKIKRDGKMETIPLIYWISVKCTKIRLDEDFLSITEMSTPYLIHFIKN